MYSKICVFLIYLSIYINSIYPMSFDRSIFQFSKFPCLIAKIYKHTPPNFYQ